ncbi:hypothetical protein [Ferribacterium limneticum]|uniref:hypothetical protein n=1 Tax=Ferribacterium limneticum TaxID=76259 RepID=UPI001CF99612|nr:hypothetical protein [Ferribacterium limneticum]UCV17748.1 hypothetical protein KI610_13080 [Ferribacterium limneticum]
MNFNLPPLSYCLDNSVTELQKNCSGLVSVSLVLGGIHDTLAEIQNSLSTTITAIYSGTTFSAEDLGIDQHVLEKTLEYRLDLSEAFEQLHADSIDLDRCVVAYCAALIKLSSEAQAKEVDHTSEGFKELLINAKEKLDEISLWFLVYLCQVVFLNFALKFSNQLLKVHLAERDSGSGSVSAVFQVIDAVNEVLSSQRGHGFENHAANLENVFWQFLQVIESANSSAINRDQEEFCRSFLECERLSQSFVAETRAFRYA